MSNNGMTRRSKLLLDSPLEALLHSGAVNRHHDPTTNIEPPARRRLLTTDKP
jgi:hypothetical protein